MAESSEGRASAYWTYRLGAEALRLLPGPVSSGLAGAFGRLVAARSPERRAVVAENLRHVVGNTLSEEELDRLVRRSFSAYARYWSDAARLRPERTAEFDRSWSIEGAENFLDAARAGRGVVLALPHLGSWEAGGVWAARVGFPLTSVAEPLRPKALFDWFLAERRALGIDVLPLGGSTASELSARLRAGRPVALLADRDVVGDGLEVELFGATTRLPAGPAVLALRTGAALLPCAVYHGRRDRHHAVIEPPLPTERQGRLREDALRVTQSLAAAIEPLIRRAPEQWHVFQPNWPPSGPASEHLGETRQEPPCESPSSPLTT